MRRGDVYWADLVLRSGSEQTGRRPVVIITHDSFNLNPGWNSLLVVPISKSTSQARRGPTVVALASGIAGVPKASFAICHQVTTLDRSKVGKRLGRLPAEILNQVEDALKAAMDLQ